MKFWKKICLCAALGLSIFSFSACSCSRTVEVAVDLDGDGVIENWENLYESVGVSSRNTTAGLQVVEISDLAGLKSINENTNQTVAYKLVRNIDCGGEILSLNLSKSILLGNNRVIKNFKLGQCNYNTEGNEIDANIYGLFYNGVGIYDLRLFMGNQTINVDNAKSKTVISSIINPFVIDNVSIKGKLNINRQDLQGLSDNSLDASLLYAGLDEVITAKTDETDESSSANILSSSTILSNATIEGEIVYGGNCDNTTVRLAGVTPVVNMESSIYNVTTDIKFDTDVKLALRIGSVVAENNGFVSTAVCNGSMDMTYTTITDNDAPVYRYNVGGVVGVNYASGEIKNVTSNMKINFDRSASNSARASDTLNIGGVAGNAMGVITYAVSDAEINVGNSTTLYAGGLVGKAQDLILSNIISRGSINCSNAKELYIADMVGYSKHGYYETCVITTNLTVDNSAINSSVYSGLVTIFENMEIMSDVTGSNDIRYNGDNSPSFKGVLVAGKTKITTKLNGENDSSNTFRYNLGLRNVFTESYDKDGGIIATREVTEDEDTGETTTNVFSTATFTPDQYSSLFILDRYSIEKFTVTGETTRPTNLVLTYAKDKTTSISSSILNIAFFVSDLGFKYGLNHNEINLSTVITLEDLKFTLTSDSAKTKYYEVKSYNGDLAYFDRTFEKACSYDTNDEMYSFINNLILSQTVRGYFPLRVSKAFAESMQKAIDDSANEGDTTNPVVPVDMTIYEKFTSNISSIISLFNVTPTVTYLNDRKVAINGEDTLQESNVRYVKFSIESGVSNASYSFLFDIRELVECASGDNYQTADYFTLFLQFTQGVIVRSID